MIKVLSGFIVYIGKHD